MATEPKVAQELEELEAETVEVPERPRGARRFWSWLWPKLAALAIFLAAWQAVVWSGWRPESVLPGPLPVFQRLAHDLGEPDFYIGVAITMRRALVGWKAPSGPRASSARPATSKASPIALRTDREYCAARHAAGTRR